jgi:hypothetical protein
LDTTVHDQSTVYASTDAVARVVAAAVDTLLVDPDKEDEEQ